MKIISSITGEIVKEQDADLAQGSQGKIRSKDRVRAAASTKCRKEKKRYFTNVRTRRKPRDILWPLFSLEEETQKVNKVKNELLTNCCTSGF